MNDQRTTRPYAKAHLDILRRHDLSPPEKLILFVLERLQRLEEDWTTARLVYETGMEIRTVQVALKSLGLARRRGRPKCAEKSAEQCAEKSAEFAHFAAPHKRSYNSNSKNREHRRGGKEATNRPPLVAPQPAETTAAAEPLPSHPVTQSPGHPAGSIDALAARVAALQTRPEPPGDIAAVIQEDLDLGRYRRADLEAVLDRGRRIDALAYRLREVVPAAAKAIAREALLARLRIIKAAGYVGGVGPGGKLAAIDAFDQVGPALVLRERVLVRDGWVSGERIMLSTLADLAAWTWRCREAVLFDPGGPAPAGNPKSEPRMTNQTAMTKDERNP